MEQADRRNSRRSRASASAAELGGEFKLLLAGNPEKNGEAPVCCFQDFFKFQIRDEERETLLCENLRISELGEENRDQTALGCCCAWLPLVGAFVKKRGDHCFARDLQQLKSSLRGALSLSPVMALNTPRTHP